VGGCRISEDWVKDFVPLAPAFAGAFSFAYPKSTEGAPLFRALCERVGTTTFNMFPVLVLDLSR
jgi:hypothetical protein